MEEKYNMKTNLVMCIFIMVFHLVWASSSDNDFDNTTVYEVVVIANIIKNTNHSEALGIEKNKEFVLWPLFELTKGFENITVVC